MSARLSRNNVKAGLFLLIALFAALLVAMQLGNVYGWLTESRTSYVFRFSIDDGAMGLKKGSMVKVGGQPVGEVTAVSFSRPMSAKEVEAIQTRAIPFKRVAVDSLKDTRIAPEAVYVTVSLKSDVLLYRDAKVFLELPLLGNVSTINIPDVGGEQYNVPAGEASAVKSVRVGALSQWEMIPGTLAPPAFLGQAGYGADQKEQLQVILQRGSEIAGQVKDMVVSTRGTLDKTMNSLKDAADNVSETTGRVNKKLPDWIEIISSALTNVNGAADEGRQRLIEAKALVAVVKNTIDENRATIDRIFASTARTVDNAAEITGKLNTELYEKVKEALVDGRKAMAKFADLGERVDKLVAEKTPEIGHIIANARLAGDQLKLTMTEIRRNPWRMLYQPTRREIEEELTYDAARTYAEAVSQLRASSESLEAIVAGSGSSDALQRERLEQITKDIQGAFSRYQDAERKFLDRLTKEK